MQTKILLIALIVCLTQQAFTPIEGLECDAANTGTKTNAYEGQTFADDTTFEKLGESHVGATANGVAIDCNIVILKKGDTYKINCVTPDLTVYSQLYTSPTPTEFLQTRDHLLITKEFNADKTSFVYGVYWFERPTAHVPNLGRITINQLDVPATDPRHGLVFNRFLQFYSWTVYLAFTSDTRTEVWVKATGSSGNPQTVKLVANTKLNVGNGNELCLYDTISNQWYQYAGADTTPYNAVARRTTTAGSEFGSVVTGTLGFYKLYEYAFAITSSAPGASPNTFDNFYGFYNMKDSVLDQGDDIGSAIAPIVHKNRYNFIFVSGGKIAWDKRDSNGVFRKDIFSSLAAADLAEAKTDFTNAIKVAFHIEKAFVLLPDSVVIYELSTASDVVTANKIGKILLSNSLVSQLTGTTSLSVKMNIQCKCTQTKLSTFVCFSSTLKCMASVSAITETCTAPYTDNVAEFK